MLKSVCLSKIFLFLIFYSPIQLANSQEIVDIKDSMHVANQSSAMDRYHETLRHNDPIMYLAVPFVEPIVKRKVALLDGEGKNGYWIEGHFGYRFVIYEGKDYSYSLFQRLRLTFDVSITDRLTQDDSSPLLPGSNKFGFGSDILLSSLKKLRESRGGMVWTSFQVHHYSNGAADSFYLDVPEKRNNYNSGDFSSNYWRTFLNISTNTERKNLVITGLGYQKEIDFPGALGSNNELKNYYGDGRWLFVFHWIKKPKLETVRRLNRGPGNGDTVTRKVRRHFGIRTELEYLTGDLSAFPGENKYRLAWHNYITYMPSFTNEIGFMVHTYLGRDYLNIRFDDIVFIGELGLYFKFNGK